MRVFSGRMIANQKTMLEGLDSFLCVAICGFAALEIVPAQAHSL